MDRFDFLKAHFDKLLLSSLFLISFGILIHFVRAVEFYSTPATATHLTSVVNWLQNTVGQILAALLTLLVGARLGVNNAPAAAPGAGAGNGGAAASTPPPLIPQVPLAGDTGGSASTPAGWEKK